MWCCKMRLIHVILNEGLEDRDYINANTNGFDELAKEVQNYDPTSAAKICGIDEDTIRTVARLYAKANASDEHLDDGHQPKHPRFRWRGGH